MNLGLKNYLLLNVFILFFISLNNVFNFDLINLTLILSIFFYAIKWNDSEWLVPFFIFVWGIFQDILLGINFGYSGSIFLFFYLLSQLTSNYGVFDQQNIKFMIFVMALLILFTLKNLYFYLNYDLFYLSVGEFSSFLIIVLFYIPLNSIILFIQKKYEKIR